MPLAMMYSKMSATHHSISQQILQLSKVPVE